MNERKVLEVLASREAWMVSDLPDSCPVEALRILDRSGYIEARAWTDENESTPDQIKPLVWKPGRVPWVSPTANPAMMGRWMDFWQRARSGDRPVEVRLSEEGLDRLFELGQAPVAKGRVDRPATVG